MGLDHLLKTGSYSPDPDVNDLFVDDVLAAVVKHNCTGPSLGASLRFLVDHLSKENLQVVRVINAEEGK